MTGYVLDEEERWEFDEQIDLERDRWPAVVVRFHVAAKVLW